MSRFFIPKDNITDGAARVTGAEAKHIMNVMRMGPGDHVVFFDGTGREYDGIIKETKTREVLITITGERPDKKNRGELITLVQAIPKKDKMDYIVEKSTELGVGRIIPVVTQRTIVRMDDSKAGVRVSRWRHLALEAAKQCGRPDVPDVSEVTALADVYKGLRANENVLMACLTDNTEDLGSVARGLAKGPVTVFIGPEGDFTPEEIKTAGEKGARLISLGERVLKSDTAGLYVLSVLDYEFQKK